MNIARKFTRICMRSQGILFMENKAKLRFGDDVNGNDCIPMQQVQVTTRCR